MVLEGVVVTVLNRFLGPYVKNLDSSQLKVAIWSGEVHLEGLELKEGALTQFDIPLRVFKGRLGKLHLSIPWKNLYNEPVVIELDGFYAVVGPESAVKYDYAREVKEEREKKQRKLKEIDEARKKANDPATPKQDPGFVEKLITQIIRNVQLSVKNIHICYEDKVSSKSPFTCGITLDSLLLKSTNGKWEVGGTADTNRDNLASPIIYKLVRLDCFGLYWNSGSAWDDKQKHWIDTLRKQIARQKTSPPDSIHYIINPLSAVAKLQLTTRPGEREDVPMLNADLIVQDILVSLEKKQYLDVLGLTESLDRMVIGRKYRKYHPNVALSSNPRAWWQYAYCSVLEEDVKRRLYMWSWKRMKKHKSLCKEYVKLYTEKLVAEGNAPPYVMAKIEDIEDELDIFNITVCRQMAENQAEKKMAELQRAQAESGWFSGWFGGGGSQNQEQTEKLPSEEELAEEKKKLYAAIGYSEKGKAASYSQKYVAHQLQFHLEQVAVKLQNDSDDVIGKLLTRSVSLDVKHRPASKNISVQAVVQKVVMTGSQKTHQNAPCLVSTEAKPGEPLLSVGFDLNPMNSKCDQKIRVSLQPVKVLYDAVSVDNIIDMFLPPVPVKLQKMSSSVTATLATLRTQTRAGLEHAINNRKLMDIDIIVYSPIVYIPENGSLNSNSNVLVINLGSLGVRSDMKHIVPSVREATSEELVDAFYDHLNLNINGVQMVFKRGDGSECHLIEPIHFSIGVHKSLLPNDTNLPGVKVDGELPLVSITLSDEILKDVFKLAQSLPVPPPALSNRKMTEKFSDIPIVEQIGTEGILLVSKCLEKEIESSDNSDEFVTASEGEEDETLPSPTMKEKFPPGEVQSTTKLALKLTLSSVAIKFCNKETKVLDLCLSSLSVGVDVKSWETSLRASVSSLMILDHYKTTVPVQLLSSDQSTSLITALVLLANRDAPHYKSKYNTTEKTLTVSMAVMKLSLRQETVCYFLDFLSDFSSLLKSSDKQPAAINGQTAGPSQSKEFAGQVETTPIRTPITGETLICLSVDLSGAELALSNAEIGTMVIASVNTIQLSATKTVEETSVKASIKQFVLIDPSDKSVKVVYSDEGSNCVDSKLVMYEDPRDDIDMILELSVGRVKVFVSLQLVVNLLVFLRALKISDQSIDKAKSSAKSTASAAVTKVQEREKSNKRIKLNVSLDAPDVTLPSKGPTSLVVRLGSLYMSNTFVQMDSLLFEQFSIELSSVQLYRCNGDAVDDVLKPFGLTALVKRNLSSVYQHYPMVAMEVKFTELELLLSQSDTDTLNEVLDYNMKHLSGLSAGNTGKGISSGTSENETSSESEEIVDRDVKEAEYQLLKIGVTFNSLTLKIFRSKSGHEVENGVALVNAEGLTANCTVSSTSAISFEMSLGSAIIDDIRNDSHAKFQSVLSKSSTRDVLLICSGCFNREEITAKLTVQKPELSLNVPFVLFLLITLGEISSPLRNKSDQQIKQVEDERKPQVATSFQLVKPDQHKKAANTSTTQRKLTVNVSIVEPRLLLLAIQDSEKADSFIVECNVEYTLHSEEGEIKMFAGLNGVKINCYLSGRDNMCLPVLSPCDISSSFSTPGGSRKNVSLNMGIMQLSMSPSIVRVMLRFLEDFRPKEEDVKVGPTAPDDLWLAKPVDYSKWFFQPLIEEESMLGMLLLETSDTKKEEFLCIDIQQVCILVHLEDPSTGQLSSAFSLLVGCYKSHGLKIIVEEWSGKLKAEATLCVVMSAYNTSSDNWEPVLEPTVEQNGDVQYYPWTLQMTGGRGSSKASTADFSVSISSENALQITLTKSSISMILALVKSYLNNETDNLTLECVDANLRNSSILFRNRLGPSYMMKLTPKDFIKSDVGVIELSPGKEAELIKADNSLCFMPGEIIPPSKQQQPIVNVSVLGFQSFDIRIKSSGSKYYPLKPNRGNDVLGMVIDVDRQRASDPTVVTFRSPLQIKNHLEIPLKVYYTPAKSKDLLEIKSLKPAEQMALPVNVAHSGHLHFQPHYKNAKASSHEVSWRLDSKGVNIHCPPVFLHVKPETEKYLDRLPFSLSGRPHHILHVYCTVVIHNHLPHHQVRITSHESIPPGGKLNLYECDPTRKYEAAVKVKDRNTEYSGHIHINKEEESSSFCLVSSEKKELEIAVHQSLKGSLHVSLYSKCLVVNQTGLDLEYSTKDFWGSRKTMKHSRNQEYLLFPGMDMFVRITGNKESDWSNKFSLDAIGNEGVFTCKLKNSPIELQMGSKVRLSTFSQSKIVTIASFYLLANNTRDVVSVLEYGQPLKNMIKIQPGKVIPFWPIESKKLLTVDINSDDSFSTFSKPFDYSANGSFFLKLCSKVSGVSVHVQVTPSAGLISFNPYYDGALPIQLMNTLKHIVIFGQCDKADGDQPLETHMLHPGQSQFYTWDKPSGIHKIMWGVATGSRVQFKELKLKDGSGSVPLPKEQDESSKKSQGTIRGAADLAKKVHWRHTSKGTDLCYWVCFSDSFQRVILFTDDLEVSKHASIVQQTKMIADVSMSLKALSVSLVNDLKRTEVCYIGLSRSEAIWEKKKEDGRYVPVELALGQHLEQLYEENTTGIVKIPGTNSSVHITSSRSKEVVLMQESKPPLIMRRGHFDGFSATVSFSRTTKLMSLKINRVQIDNHLPFALNPTIFYCYPPAPSLAATSIPKPFFEGSLIMKTNEGAGNNEIQFLQVLIQEMGFILDIEFLLELLNLIELKQDKASDEQLLSQELEFIKENLAETEADQITSRTEKLNYKFVHLSPLDIHISFSLEVSEEKKEEMLFYADSNALLKMFMDFFHALVGIFGQAKDSELKLGFFEIQEKALTRNDLIKRVTKHYQQQFLFQMYSVVFGLEVLGNPVGFLRGLTEGTIGLFYQPIKGAVLGPDEFLEGLALGTHQFLGGTVGGLAGMGAKVTGVFGDVVAKLTFDEEFMEKRQRQRSSFGQGLESLSKGVYHGVTGVVAQPIKGAEKEGLLGFLKGTGKGVLGLVLRPAGGLIDFTSATLSAVQRKTKVGDFELTQIRASRYIGPDKVVYPYSSVLAEGYAVFMLYEDGKLYNQETYIGYIELSQNPLKSLLVTNSRFMVLKEGGTFVTKWEDDLTVKYQHMLSEGIVDKWKVVNVSISEEESWLGGLVPTSGKKAQTNKKISAIPPTLAVKAQSLINSGYKINKKEALLKF